MISWLKNNNRFMHLSVRSEKGNALPIVLIFAAAGLITVSSFLFFQYTFAKPSLKNPASLQALLNARSGIYKGFEQLTDTVGKTSGINPLINTLDSSFKADMIGKTDSVDTTSKDSLTLDGGTVTYKLYTGDSLGGCEVSLIPDGGACILRSIGTFRSSTFKVDAVLGSKIPALPDTVIVCYNTFAWDGPDPKGVRVNLPNPPDSASKGLKKLIKRYQDSLVIDSAIMDPPLTISANNDFKKIQSIVHGDLLIDGSYNSLSWKDTATITVLGNITINNDVKIDGVKFVALGQIILSGKAAVTRAVLFSESKIFIGDNSRFVGNALALNSVAIYGNATVDEKSTIIVSGDSSNFDKADKGKTIYSIEIGDRAVVDGVLIALGSPGDIKTHPEVKIKGLMIAQKSVGHLGKMKGLICAGSFIDPDTVGQTPSGGPHPQKNILKGEIEPLTNIEEYHLPFFLGKLSITAWKEY